MRPEIELMLMGMRAQQASDPIQFDMDEKEFDRWVKALKDGSYKQGASYLRSVTSDGESAFCCLGVLADLTDDESWQEQTDCREIVGYDYQFEGHYGQEFLPDEMPKSLGFNHIFEIIVAEWNDDNVPFTDIAEALETITYVKDGRRVFLPQYEQ